MRTLLITAALVGLLMPVGGYPWGLIILGLFALLFMPQKKGRPMRKLLILLALAALGGCTSTKYSDVPTLSGDWVPANAAPDSTDNNILPDFARGVVS